MANQPKLTKSQLAALDMMIAHMQENNTHVMGRFIGSIISSVTNAAHSVANVATNATSAATNIATNVAHATTNAATNIANAELNIANRGVSLAQNAVSNVANNATNVANAARNAVSNSYDQISGPFGAFVAANNEISTLAGTLHTSGLENLTLDELIKLRNQYAK